VTEAKTSPDPADICLHSYRYTSITVEDTSNMPNKVLVCTSGQKMRKRSRRNRIVTFDGHSSHVGGLGDQP